MFALHEQQFKKNWGINGNGCNSICNNNRKTYNTDIYTFTVTGANSISGVLKPCPTNAQIILESSDINPNDADNILGASIACDPNDTYLGHYWGSFVPTATGMIVISVYLNDTIAVPTGVGNQTINTWSPTLVGGKTFSVLITPSTPIAQYTTVQGDLYDKIAGTEGTITLQLWDTYKNRVYTGGDNLELAMLGVAGMYIDVGGCSLCFLIYIIVIDIRRLGYY